MKYIATDVQLMQLDQRLNTISRLGVPLQHAAHLVEMAKILDAISNNIHGETTPAETEPDAGASDEDNGT